MGMEEWPLLTAILINKMKDLVYLSGAMDAAPDYGTGWRDELESFLSKIGIKCFNPCREEEILLGLSHHELTALREKDRARYIENVKKLMVHDLEVIRIRTKCLIAYIDEHVKAGTYGEVIFAYSQSIPVYIISGLLESHIPGWILACATKIFLSIEECIGFFKEMQLRTKERTKREVNENNNKE